MTSSSSFIRPLPGQHHVDLLGLLVAVGERLAPVRLDAVEREPNRLGAQVLARETRLLHLLEPEPRRQVVDLAEVLDRVAHDAQPTRLLRGVSEPRARAPASAPRARIRQRQLPAARGGMVHPRLAPEPEHVLGLDHRRPAPARRTPGGSAPTTARARAGCPCAASSAVDPVARDRIERLVPPACRVVVVRARVHDPVLDVVLEPVRAVRVGRIERELRARASRGARARPAAARPRGDHAEVLGDQRQPALERRAPRHRVEHGRPGPRFQLPAPRGARPRGTAQ